MTTPLVLASTLSAIIESTDPRKIGCVKSFV